MPPATVRGWTIRSQQVVPYRAVLEPIDLSGIAGSSSDEPSSTRRASSKISQGPLWRPCEDSVYRLCISRIARWAAALVYPTAHGR